MAKTFYSDYVAHATRFFFVWEENKGFRHEVDKLNYLSVKAVLGKLPKTDFDFIRDYYTEHKRATCAQEFQLVSYYEKCVAQTRRLIQ